MSKRKEMIRIFDSMSNFNTYSKYSIILSKIFRKHSLKNYVSSLKNPIHIEEFEILKDNEPKNINKNDFGLKLINPEKKPNKKKKELDLLNDDGKEDKNKYDNFNKNKKNKFSYFFHQVNKRKDYFDPFKYKPNYNSIYKNIHGFKIVSPKTLSLKAKSTEKYDNLKINNFNLDFNSVLSPINKKLSDELNSFHSDSTTLSVENGLKSTKYKTLPDLKNSTHKPKIKIKSKLNYNHTRSFSKYVSRKSNVYKVNNKLTYLEPNKLSLFNKEKSKSIDFNKMIKRNSIDLMNKQILYNPSFTYYNPKFNLIEQKPTNVFLNSKNIERRSKKYMLKKVWTSYYVCKDYLLIDNNKLNNDIKANLECLN